LASQTLRTLMREDSADEAPDVSPPHPALF